MFSVLYMSDSVSVAGQLSEIDEALAKKADEVRISSSSITFDILTGSYVNCRTCNKRFINSLGHDCCPSHVSCLVNRTEYVPSKCNFCQSAMGFAILEARKGNVESVQHFQGAFQVFWKKLKRARDNTATWIEPKFTSVFKSRPAFELAKLKLSDIIDPDSITQHGGSEAGSEVGSKASHSSKTSHRPASERSSSTVRSSKFNAMMETMMNRFEKIDKDRQEDKKETQDIIAKAMESVTQRFFSSIPSLPGDSDAHSSFSGFDSKGKKFKAKKTNEVGKKEDKTNEGLEEEGIQDKIILDKEEEVKEEKAKKGKEDKVKDGKSKKDLVKQGRAKSTQVNMGNQEKVHKEREERFRSQKEGKGKALDVKEKTEELKQEIRDFIFRDRSRSPIRKANSCDLADDSVMDIDSYDRTTLLRQHLAPQDIPVSSSFHGSRISSPGHLTSHTIVADTHLVPSSSMPSASQSSSKPVFRIPKIPPKKPLLPTPPSPSNFPHDVSSPPPPSSSREFKFAFVDVPEGHKVISVAEDPTNPGCMVPQKLMDRQGVVYDVPQPRRSRSHSLPSRPASPLLTDPASPLLPEPFSSSRPSVSSSPTLPPPLQNPQSSSSVLGHSFRVSPTAVESFAPADEEGKVDMSLAYKDFTGCVVFDIGEFKIEEDLDKAGASPFDQAVVRKPASVSDVCKNIGQWFELSKNVKLLFFTHKPDLLHYITLFDDTSFLARVVALFFTKGVATHFKIRLDHRVKMEQTPKSFKPLVTAAITNSLPVLLKEDKPSFPVCRDWKRSCLVTLTGESPYPHDFSLYRKWLQEMVNNSDFQVPLDSLPPSDFLFSASDTLDLLAPFFDEEISRNAISQEFNIPLTANNKLPVKLVKAEFEARYEVSKVLVSFQGVNSSMATLKKLQSDKMALNSMNSMYGFMPALSFVLVKSISRWLQSKLALRRAALVSFQSEDVNQLLMSDPFESTLFCVQTVEEVRTRLQQSDKSLRSLVAKDGPISRFATVARARAIRAKYGRYVSNRSDSSSGLKSFSAFRSNTRANFRQRGRGNRGSFSSPSTSRNRGRGRGAANKNLLFRGGYRGASSSGNRVESSGRAKQHRQDNPKINN